MVYEMYNRDGNFTSLSQYGKGGQSCIAQVLKGQRGIGIPLKTLTVYEDFC